MTLWVLLFVGLTLALAGAVALGVAMLHAERRARRNLYRALGFAEETVELLLARSSDILSELTLLRRSQSASESDVAAAAGPTTEDPAAESRDVSLSGEAALFRPQTAHRPARPAEARLPANRRLPYADRHRRL